MQPYGAFWKAQSSIKDITWFKRGEVSRWKEDAEALAHLAKVNVLSGWEVQVGVNQNHYPHLRFTHCRVNTEVVVRFHYWGWRIYRVAGKVSDLRHGTVVLHKCETFKPAMELVKGMDCGVQQLEQIKQMSGEFRRSLRAFHDVERS